MGSPDGGDGMQEVSSDEENLGSDMTVIINQGGLVEACAKPDVLDLMRRAPRLLQVCAEMSALKDMRSVSRASRILATSHISGLAIDCQQPVTALHLQSVLSLLGACSLQRFRVVMHLEHHERVEDDLSAISAILGSFLAKVTQLNIVLYGTEPEGDFTACEPSHYPPLGMQAACTVQALAPHCSPLLQVSVSGKVEAPTDFCLLPLLAAAQGCCASSLTHITVNLPRVIDLMSSSEALLPSFPSLNEASCSALHSFTRLTHLHLDGFVESPNVWPALPATLRSLELDFIIFGPSAGVILPSLQRLVLNQCGCSELALLLRAAPSLQQLFLREICSPSTTAAATALVWLHDHPLLRLDNDGPTDLAVTGTIEFGHSYNAGTSDLEVQLGLEIAPWKILPQLPCMPAILRCNFDSVHSDQGEGPPLDWDNQPEAYLHHIPRIFPRITHLDLSCAIRPDSDFEALHACTALTSLKLSRCDKLSDAGLIDLATSLTGLVSFGIELCRCVSVEAEGVIEQMMIARNN